MSALIPLTDRIFLYKFYSNGAQRCIKRLHLTPREWTSRTSAFSFDLRAAGITNVFMSNERDLAVLTIGDNEKRRGTYFVALATTEEDFCESFAGFAFRPAMQMIEYFLQHSWQGSR